MINNTVTLMKERPVKTSDGALKLAEEIARAAGILTESKKYYAIMFFETELNLGLSTKPNKWVNIGNRFFNDGTEALSAYANTPCPASQLIDAASKEELLQEMTDMYNNYQDEAWLDENLYPYL